MIQSILFGFLFVCCVFAQQKCNIPPSWKVTINCEGGTAEQTVGRGLVLTCPNSIPPNTDGIIVHATDAFVMGVGGGGGDMEIISPKGAAIDTGPRPFVSFRAESVDNGLLEATILRGFADNTLVLKSKLPTSETIRSNDFTLEQDDTQMEVHFERMPGESAATITAETLGDSQSEKVLTWTQANFTVSAVLGNAGEKASTGKHEAVLVYLQDWNGKFPLKGNTSCIIHGEFQPTPMPTPMPPTPLPTPNPTPPPGSGCEAFFQCQLCKDAGPPSSSEDCKWCQSDDNVPNKGKCVAADSVCDAPYSISIAHETGTCPTSAPQQPSGEGCTSGQKCAKLVPLDCPAGQSPSSEKDACGCEVPICITKVVVNTESPASILMPFNMISFVILSFFMFV